MDTSKIQAFPQNVLVRKISLNRLKNLQKLSVYEKSVFKKRACASKNNYGPFNILPVLSKEVT